MAGSLKLTREQLALITGGDPRAIKAFEDFFLAINNLGQHHTTHEPGGSDPLTVDAIPGVGSLRTLGTGAQKAAAGIHAATHLIGGGDAIAFAPYVDTAANLAAANPVLAVGQLGWESDTLSGKIGDGSTAYNSLIYSYRGLPVAGEPSLGTPHPTKDANRTATLVVNTSTNTAGVWSAAVTMTGVPAGAKAAWCLCDCYSAGGQPYLCVEAASGYTLSDITSGSNAFKYMGFKNRSGATQPQILKIHLDSNGQFKWCTSFTNSTVQIGSAIDYDE